MDKKLKEKFFSTYKSSNHEKNKFTLLLREVVYMDNWEKFNETSLLEKKGFLQ